MRKQLILCRHAEAAAPLPGQTDRERPLTEAGKRQATEAGRWLQQHSVKPDLIISSPAKRTLATTRILLEALNQKSFTQNEAIYEASEADLLAIVNELPDAAEVVLLVGHNPGISFLTTRLTGYPVSFETGRIMAIRLEAERWAEVSAGTGST